MNAQPPECAAKPVHGLPPTPDWQTSTSSIDDRRIQVIANGLALWGGAHTTLVSPLTRAGEPRRQAGRFAGAALTDARKAKERAYPELLHNSRCRLVVLGIEVGGRWSEEAASFITSLARTKTRDTPAPLRHAAASLISRWTAFLTHAAMTAFAASLLFEDPTHHHNLDGEPPSLSDLLAQLPPDPTHPADYPHILPDSLLDFALDFAHLETSLHDPRFAYLQYA